MRDSTGRSCRGLPPNALRGRCPCAHGRDCDDPVYGLRPTGNSPHARDRLQRSWSHQERRRASSRARRSQEQASMPEPFSRREIYGGTPSSSTAALTDNHRKDKGAGIHKPVSRVPRLKRDFQTSITCCGYMHQSRPWRRNHVRDNMANFRTRHRWRWTGLRSKPILNECSRELSPSLQCFRLPSSQW